MPGARAARTDHDTIEVLECNWTAVQVYLACMWQVSVGMAQLVWFGISAQEACAAMFALRVPRAAWGDTLRRLRVMTAAVAPIRNKVNR